MATRLYREYKFKFYLNANHYIIINGKNGQTHPHTWEFVFYIMKSEGEFVLFNKFEKAIEEYLEKFQGRVMNEIPPFDTMVPTLENISDYFCDEIRSIITKLGGELLLWRVVKLRQEVILSILGMVLILKKICLN